jgi:hypothetical protein
MEIILAIVVVAAVIFFGALISMGNERQRKAIDGLREQTVLWAIQDLRIKRERLAREVQVNNPVDWLNKTTAKVCGFNLNVQVVEFFDGPPALVCASAGGTNQIIFSPFSPTEIRQINRNKRSRLSQYSDRNPLLSMSRHVQVYELSVLNGGILLDLELPLAWKSLTNQDAENLERLWVYISN